ncbi:hypothetical protein AKJ62_00080 [candidate division MSBL1 archaeon SCGC-AAA259D14]|uniref:Uncharacterized protein n=1 Tax=candidate division MSBL1 archaeon SCGC-AAA259D14 TaxID=1698261 RepID=A0A133U941_9EURY|nr:hypothetical protein AKJ62_00080 [candidate division MSBL1 archaeon SCGC-AAA259D14]
MVRNLSKIKLAIISIITLIIFTIPLCSAHVPKEVEGNNTLETALIVDDPTKSWAIYAKIHEKGEAQYYRLELEESQILRASLFVPNKDSFVPNLIIGGLSLETEGVLPDDVQIPEDYGYIVKEGNLEDPEYEPFTPASYYYLADFEKEIEDTGTYYVIVSDPDGEGNYGLAIGKEERYGLVEWIRVPLDIIKVRQWEGLSLLYIFLPMILTIIVGFFLLIWFGKSEPKRNYTVLGWLVVSSGLLYFGSGVMKFVEMIVASGKANPGPLIVVTVVFASLPVVLGIFTIRKGIEFNGDIYLKDRIYLAVYGILALFVWAGFILGSIIIFLASVLPSKILKK